MLLFPIWTFIPQNEVDGFSADGNTTNLYWWTGNQEQDPWEHRAFIAHNSIHPHGKSTSRTGFCPPLNQIPRSDRENWSLRAATDSGCWTDPGDRKSCTPMLEYQYHIENDGAGKLKGKPCYLPLCFHQHHPAYRPLQRSGSSHWVPGNNRTMAGIQMLNFQALLW